MVIGSWAAVGNSDVHLGPSWSGKLEFPRAMTRDVEQCTSSGRGQRSSSFTGASEVPERVKSQLGSAGANPQRGCKFKVLQSCLENRALGGSLSSLTFKEISTPYLSPAPFSRQPGEQGSAPEAAATASVTQAP